MDRQFPGILARRVGVLAVIAAAAASLAGCETVDAGYGRRHVTVPTPVAGSQAADASSIGTLKLEGTQPVAGGRGRDALAAPEYYYGSGRVVADPLGRDGVATDDASGAVSLNFVNTGILEVADVILGKTLGLNYVIDANVQGTVTARTSKPVPRSSVLPVLENILALNGAAMVESEGVYNIVPLAAAASLPKVVVTPSRHPQQPGIGIYVIPLDFASVDSVKDVVSAQVSPGNQMAIDHARNLLIYTGPSREAQSIAEMVSVLDVDVLAGMSFALFPVQASSATDVASELEALFGEDATGARAGAVRFLPIERLNAILAVSARPENLRHAGDWVDRLDRADAGADRKVFVYYARNRRAKELAEVLGQVFPGPAGARAEAAPRADVAPGLEAVELIAPPLGEPGSVEAADVGAVADAGDAGMGAFEAGLRGAAPDSGIGFVADDQNNAIVVTATAEQFQTVEATLRRLDILPLQVLIEATIAEVRLNDGLQYGLQWAFESGKVSESLTNNTAGSLAPSFPGFNFVLDTANATVVLNALSEITDVEVVSSPHLMVLDNQSARLQIGDQVPIVTQTSVSTVNPEAPIVNSVQYFDTGVILEVTPRVNAGGLVTMEIIQEVSDAVATKSSGINSPTIQQRSIRSIVAVQSGETVALGGLIRESSTETVSGIPLLKDVPLLGNLFKTTGQDDSRTELLVLITPRVVRGPAQAREVTEELRQRLTMLRSVVATSR